MSLQGARILVSGAVLGQPMGGVHRHNAELLPRVADLLAEQGARLSILEGKVPTSFDLPDSVERISSEVPAGPPLARAWTEGRAVRAALQEASQAGEPFALFHTAHLPTPRRIEVPTTLTLHDLRRIHRSHAGTVRRVSSRLALRRAITNSARVFCVSQSVRNELSQRFGLAPDRTRVISNAADHFIPAARDATADASLLYIGHLEPRKNLELLLRALASDANLPALDFAGAAKGREADRLADAARQLGVASRVRFLGAVSEEQLTALLARTACVVLPSRIEGFGISVLEAQLAKAPLAIASTDALREVAGADVPHFSPDDASACAEAIRAAMVMTSQALSEARKHAQRYSWNASARVWFDAWAELIRASR